MAISKFEMIINRCFGILEMLLVGVFALWLFYMHEYIGGIACIILVIFAIYRFVKDYSKLNIHYYWTWIYFIWPFYHEYSKYKQELRADNYGLRYNKNRQNLGIPTIPADWHIEDTDNHSVFWEGKDGVMGHEEKLIAFDSLYRIKFERDEYNFKSIHDTTRSISILFDYGRGNSKDSIIYWYNLKDTTLTISRHEADSLLDAANVKKDY